MATLMCYIKTIKNEAVHCKFPYLLLRSNSYSQQAPKSEMTKGGFSDPLATDYAKAKT